MGALAFAMRLLVKRLGWAAGILSALTFSAFLLAQTSGVLALAAYLLLVLAPGTIVFFSLVSLFPSKRLTLAESFFGVNLIGLSLCIGLGWLLARSSFFSFWGTLALEWAVACLFLAFAWRPFLKLAGSFGEPWLEVVSLDGVFIGIVAAAAVLLLLPTLLLLHEGFVNADDTATFARIANALAHSGSWDSAVRLFPNQPSGIYNTVLFDPGVCVFYALFVQFTGANAIYVAEVAYLVPLVLAPVGLFLLTRCFSSHWAVIYPLPIVWMVGSWRGGSLFFNNQIEAALFAVFPDGALSVVGYVAVLYLLTRQFQDDGAPWRDCALLSFAVLFSTLSDPLAWIFSLFALFFLGWRLLLPSRFHQVQSSALPHPIGEDTLVTKERRSRVARWVDWARGTVLTLLLITLPTLLLLPPYLTQNAAANSPAFASGSAVSSSGASLFSVSIANVDETFLPYGFIGLALCVLTLVIAVNQFFGQWSPRSRRFEVLSVVLLCALTGATTYFAFTNLASDVIGSSSARLLEYASLSLVPVVAFGANWLIQARPRLGTWARPVGVASVVGLLLLSGAAAGFGLQSNLAGASAAPVDATYFGPDLLEASKWLATNEVPGRTIVVDENLNNNALSAFSDFCPDAVLDRPGYGLYQDLTDTIFPPDQNPYFVVNQAIEFPNASNEQTAYITYGITYYVFQVGISDFEISVFSHLPYFSLAYSNPQVDIFQYAPGGEPGFIAALSYSNASAGLDPQYVWAAYSTAFDLPDVPNAVSSASAGGVALDGATLTYELTLPVSGNYTLFVHRYIYRTSEYLRVSVNGIWVGDTYYNAVGPDFGSPVAFQSDGGAVALTLTIEGNAGYVDPIDFLVLSP